MDSTFDTLKSWPSDRLDEARTVKDIHGRSNERLTGHIDYWRKETVNEFQRKLESLKKSLTPYAEQLDPDFETAYFRNSVSLVKWEDFDPNPTGRNEYPNLNPFEKGWMLPTEEWPRKLANTGICAGHILDMAKTRYRDLAENYFAAAQKQKHKQQNTESPFETPSEATMKQKLTSPMTTTSFPPSEENIRKAIEKAVKNLGRANILLAGKTGVGKSTLVNAVFGGKPAKVGMGRPVTQEPEYFSDKNWPFGLWDTRGLESASFQDTLNGILDLVKKQNSLPDGNEHIHLAWLCVQEPNKRFEECEWLLIRALQEKKVRVMVVITKANAKSATGPKFQKEIEKILNDEMINANGILRVCAHGEELLDGTIEPAWGLTELVNESLQLLEPSQRDAFIAAQEIDLKLKRASAIKAVTLSATAAGAAALNPFPFPDAAIIVPIQISMIASISVRYGLLFGKNASSIIFAAVAGPVVATITGTNLAKLLPGGSLITAAIASSITTALGMAYIEVLDEALREKASSEITSEDIRDALAAKVSKLTLNL